MDSIPSTVDFDTPANVSVSTDKIYKMHSSIKESPESFESENQGNQTHWKLRNDLGSNSQ